MNTIHLRFYEELNRYLPQERRKTWFDLSLKKETSVKKVLESLKIPLEEVDLILVNEQSVGPDYVFHENDRTSVYPVFELLDVSGVTQMRDKPLRDPKFICDSHLGRLCKYLRILGFDTLYFNWFTMNQIIETSLQENRIVLSKNRTLIKDRRVTHAYWIRSFNREEQIKELVVKLDLWRLFKPMTRCLQCNHPISPIGKSLIQERLQEKTARYYHEFFICEPCNKVYWKGSHYEAMLNWMKAL